MSFIKDLFSKNTNASMCRVLSAMCVTVGCFIAVYSMFLDKDNTGLVATLIGVGAGLKVGQKIVEVK